MAELVEALAAYFGIKAEPSAPAGEGLSEEDPGDWDEFVAAFLAAGGQPL